MYSFVHILSSYGTFYFLYFYCKNVNASIWFKRIIITSEEGHNINFNNFTAPSDFYLETVGEDFTNLNIQTNPKLLIDDWWVIVGIGQQN